VAAAVPEDGAEAEAISAGGGRREALAMKDEKGEGEDEAAADGEGSF
jgi:hypothetical protein